jgi:hypothetical protein
MTSPEDSVVTADPVGRLAVTEGTFRDFAPFVLPHRLPLEHSGRQHGVELLQAHRRVCTSNRATGVNHRVKLQLLQDALGICVFLLYNIQG